MQNSALKENLSTCCPTEYASSFDNVLRCHGKAFTGLCILVALSNVSCRSSQFRGSCLILSHMGNYIFRIFFSGVVDGMAKRRRSCIQFPISFLIKRQPLHRSSLLSCTCRIVCLHKTSTVPPTCSFTTESTGPRVLTDSPRSWWHILHWSINSAIQKPWPCHGMKMFGEAVTRTRAVSRWYFAAHWKELTSLRLKVNSCWPKDVLQIRTKLTLMYLLRLRKALNFNRNRKYVAAIYIVYRNLRETPSIQPMSV